MNDQHLQTVRHIYRLLMFAYPAEYRKDYGIPMMQTFTDLYRDALKSHGRLPLIRFWLNILTDVIVSAVLEHVSAWTRRIRMSRQGVSTLLLVIAFCILTGYVNLNASEVQAPMACILAFSFLAGLLQPKAAWRWGILIGLSVPLSYFIGFAINYKIVDPPRLPITLVVLVIPALIATYGAVLLRWAFMSGQRQAG